MKKLKLLLTLLLLCAGVGNSWAQTLANPVPFTVATVSFAGDKFALGTKWYELKTHEATGTVAKYLATDATHYNETTGLMGKSDAPTGQSGYWCFAGDQTSGYSLYNRETGNKKRFFYATGTDTKAEMKDYSYTGQTNFDILTSDFEDYYRLRAHGTTNKCVNVSGQEAQSYRLQFWDSANTASDNNSIWMFTEVGMEIEIQFVKDGANYGNPVQVAVAVGSTVKNAAIQNMPANHYFTDEDNQPTVVEGTFTYRVVIGEGLAPIDYSVCSDAQVNSTHSGRYTSQLTFNMHDNTQTVSTTQTAVKQAVYKDRTSEHITVFKGAPIVSSHNMVTYWMHGYVFVDEDKNGFSVSEAEDVDATTHILRKGSDCDLKAFTYWNGYNSDGTSQTEGQAASIKTLPAFNAPATKGNYRVRFIVNWNSIDPKGTSPGNNTINGNGGLICDVTMDVVEDYHIKYQTVSGTQIAGKAIVSDGLSVFDPVNNYSRVKVGSTVTGFLGADFLVRDFVSATLNGTTYYSWADVAAVVAADDEVTVTLADDAYVQPDKYYTIQNVATSKYAYDDPSGTDDGANLRAGVATTGVSGQHIFQVVAANPADAGIKAGSFYIQNVQTKRFVKTPSQAGSGALKTKLDRGSLPNFAHWITNGVVPGNPEIYVLADAAQVSNPTQPISGSYTWNTNNNITNIVAWKTLQNDNVTPDANSQWKFKRVPVISLSFQDGNGNAIDNPAYTATSTITGMPANTVLACFKGIAFDNYAVAKYVLNGQEYSTRTQFFEACHNLTEDATATLTLREKAEGEVDVTLQLWKAKGKGYTDADCTAGEVDFTTAPGNTSALKAWKLVVNEGDQDIKGSLIPTGIDFKIVSSADNGVGGMISNGTYSYRYGMIEGGDNCICFNAATDEGNTFEFSVADGYYILQYNLGINAGSTDTHQTFSNDGGATVATANPATGQQRYTITDTPAAQRCTFTATAENTTNVTSAANYFRVRIVNRTYLENSMERGYAICSAALRNVVGYPKSLDEDGNELTSGAYFDLKKAIADFDAEGGNTVENYIKMAQAYSKYISCTDLNMPADCQVYTLSFKNSYGTKMLVNNGDEGLEIVAYNDENKGKPSARWISHENAAGKLVFVNKKDGKYLQATASGVGVSETYDADENSFTTRATTQDMSDYMASATDEKLLGAVCMKNAAETNKLTMQNADSTFVVKTAAEFNDNFSSAMLIEQVDGGKTYTDVKFNGVNGKYYATYYGFYPVENPSDIEMYYATGTKDVNGQTYLKLQKVSQDVIKPEFPVILITENGDYADEENETTHLHIGEYTADKKSTIAGLLEANPNLLKGTLEEGQAKPEGKNIYVLSGNNNVVGFYKYSKDTLPAGKAYYEAEAGINIRGFLFDMDGVETTIELNAAETSAEDAVIYDLSGRRVNNAKNGLFIINGKKVVK